MQEGHLPAIRELETVRLVAVADVDERRLKLFQEKFGVRAYRDYSEMLARESPDAVLVAVPHTLHARVASDVLNAGAHVYVEKPMATTVEDALTLADLARKKARILMVGHEHRFGQGTLIARKFLEGGRLGKIYYARAEYVRRRGLPAGPTFVSKELARGGALFDIGSHVIDLAMFLSDFPIPVKIKGVTYQNFSDRPEMFSNYPKTQRSTRTEVEDTALGMVTFANGMTMFVEASWASYIKADRRHVAVMGDRGGVDLEGNDLSFMTTLDGEFLNSQPIQGQQFLYLDIWRRFSEAVASGLDVAPFPGTTAEQGALELMIMDAIYRSAQRGAEVEVEVPSSLSKDLGWGDSKPRAEVRG
ncbi:oxidoreductase [Sulfodiicoccus acidiphilus]|uniref:Oxidoreductase n=1 Tax=Sulfodiicoccus acidiphilus TaxID=1670455 RepID=A0A348B532_9CREN|nr:oxidoreductase [Sulfodiicoccus acidiphilus]GGT89370.1 oxidoreductase [Sulfodiicoccus acidiphilus]